MVDTYVQQKNIVKYKVIYIYGETSLYINTFKADPEFKDAFWFPRLFIKIKYVTTPH